MEIGVDFTPDDVCNKVERILMQFQWVKDGTRWRHGVFCEGFFLQNVSTNGGELTPSHRHELNGPNIVIPDWNYGMCNW